MNFWHRTYLRKKSFDIKKCCCFFFLRSDFDLATLNCNTWFEGHTPRFASMNFYETKPRYPMDDIESLIYSMWFIAGVPIGQPRNPDEKAIGELFSDCRKNGNATDLLRVS